jgi:purine-nucleoside/S-methyl-5'-thioadenosine phosphorylase / adenosine deaminase
MAADESGIYRVPELAQWEWLVHGFGTRNSPAPPRVATLRQIHSDIVMAADGRTGCLGEGDALVTNTPGTAVGVKTADCVPILLVDTRQRAVAAVHAGWRGTVRHIAQKAVAAMRENFGTQPQDLHAAIGPGIGVCCFEVGPEVAAEFGRTGRVRVDLTEVNRAQLAAIGVLPYRIYLSYLCTVCGGAEFCSYRRERERAGRMLSFVGLS